MPFVENKKQFINNRDIETNKKTFEVTKIKFFSHC